jgi:hypothetical protein
MKLSLNLFLLTLGLSTCAMASPGAVPAAAPASFFVGGCGLIFLTMAHLAWKTRRIGK